MANTITQLYLKELRAESKSARKCLEHIPESVYKFKPHEKSMEMGYLALLVAEIPKWVYSIIEDSVIDFVKYEHFKLSNTAALLAHYEENLKKAEDALSKSNDEDLARDKFYLKNNGQELYSGPKLENIGSTINHWIHHRGQLTVYLRLNDIAVPSIYGPSADDKGY